MNAYLNAVQNLEALGIMPEKPPSLEPMQRALRATGLLDKLDSKRVVIVAGTNGKGSVAATLDALLRSAGKRTGLYTSPHLIETTERFRVEGKDLSRELFVQAHQTLHPVIAQEKLSHFEALTLMAAWLFFSGKALPPVEYALLEVGLGGLWDATNAIPHDHCVITSLAKDHENLLGSTLPEIARNKFGVIGRGASVVHAPLAPELLELAREVRTTTQSTWEETCGFEYEVGYARDECPIFKIRTQYGVATLALPGKRGAQNSATALTALARLGFNPAAHLGALAEVNWPGRMERMVGQLARCPIYLSGDHNPEGVQSLLELLPYYRRAHLHLMVGVGKDKDLEGILTPLAQLENSSLHLTITPFRGRTLDEYGPWLRLAETAHSDPLASFANIRKVARPQDLIIISGSLYLVGAIRSEFCPQTTQATK